MKLNICNQTCHLLVEKAVYWEEKKTLILADIHIGKGTVFRKAGIPIPQGIMKKDLAIITDLIQRFQVEKCIIVGDFIHAKTGLSLDVQTKVAEWLRSLHCEIHLILGNHDYTLVKNLPSTWHLNVHQEGLLLEPFYFSHIPIRNNPWFVWSGHIHPKIEIKNRHDRIVLKCFQIYENLAIIPAFGFFTGGAFVKKCSECKIYAITDDQVVEI